MADQITSEPIDVNVVLKALEELPPPKTKDADFDILYPALQAKLEDGLTRRQLVELLNSMGMPMYPAKFSRMMKAAQVRLRVQGLHERAV